MAKKVFISYSHDSEDHKEWVKHLATILVKNGVEVILDQWDLRAGKDIPQFVEDSILKSDRVLLICTESYAEKANNRVGGVGVEALVINSSLMEDLGTSKFVVVVRQQNPRIQLPNLLKSRLFVDFSDDGSFEAQVEHLIKELHGVVHLDKPKLGPNPFDSPEATESNEKLDLARAYIEMGDPAGATDILIEVMEDGSLIQQKEARELLSKLRS